jgi:hypothetical protein
MVPRSTFALIAATMKETSGPTWPFHATAQRESALGCNHQQLLNYLRSHLQQTQLTARRQNC